jgi:predicted DNA-binding protein (UPF0251 family)
MPRPVKYRRVTQVPQITYFKPRGIPLAALEEIILTVDELEALRLADLNAQSHQQAAEKMKISRATFGRIIEKARRKVVDAIVNGKAILIEGGTYRTDNKFQSQCKLCNCTWKSTTRSNLRKNCPKCHPVNCKDNITQEDRTKKTIK